MTANTDTAYRQLNAFVDSSASGLLQLLVAAARRATYTRIIACPTYPAAARTSGLSMAVNQLHEAMSCSGVHMPTLLARLYASVRPLPQRKKAGQFFTAAKVAEWALSIEPPQDGDDVCDAGAGAAVFADAIVRMDLQVRSYTGVENDPLLTLCAAHVLEALGAPGSFKIWYANFLLLRKADFEAQGLRLPTLIIANPPFVRSHRLGGRARIHASLKSTLGISLSQMSGSGSYFLSRAAALTETSRPLDSDTKLNPRMLFFFPREAAGAAHARQLREDLQRVHQWSWREHMISDAQSGVDKHPSNSLALLFAFERKKLYAETNGRRLEPLFCIRDFLEIKRGISTGCNDFFVLTDEETRRRRLPRSYLQAVLPTRIPLKNSCFSENDWNQLRLAGHPCWLLALPDRTLKDFEVPVQDYLREGIRRGLHATPTAKGLRTWFSMRIPSTPPDLFVTYMFRGSPRFILNGARVLHLTNILGGRFVPAIEECTRQQAVIDALNEQAKAWMTSDSIGREYKGGLRKIEPRELSMLPITFNIVHLDLRRSHAETGQHASLFD